MCKQGTRAKQWELVASSFWAAMKSQVPHSRNSVMLYFWWGCREDLKLIIIGRGERVKSHKQDRIRHFQVRVVLYQDGVEKLALKFNGTSSDIWSWFSASALLESPYQDVKDGHNFFGIKGDERLSRYFFINKNYGSCPNDAGWLVVVGGKTCEWEKRYQPQVVLYSKKNTAVNWNNPGKFIQQFSQCRKSNWTTMLDHSRLRW